MKTIFRLLLSVILLQIFPSCNFKERLNTLENRVDDIENTKINTIQEQVAAMQTTLESVVKTDEALKYYVEQLESIELNFAEDIKAVDDKVIALEQDVQRTAEDIENQINLSKADALAQLETVRGSLQEQSERVSDAVDALDGKSKELEQSIVELQKQIEDAPTKDWITASFAALDKQNEMSEDIIQIKGQIADLNFALEHVEGNFSEKLAAALEPLKSEILEAAVAEVESDYLEAIESAKEALKAAYTQDISTAITALETSLQGWVNERLEAYSTIAMTQTEISSLKTDLEGRMDSQKTYLESLVENIEKEIDEGEKTDEKITELIEANATAIQNNTSVQAENARQIQEMNAALNESKVQITESYKSAINSAITTLDGELRGEIQKAVEAANSAVNKDVIDQMTATVSNLSGKVQTCENEIVAIRSSIASILSELQNIKDDIASLMDRIQSLTYIPEFSDGKISMTQLAVGDEGEAEIDFIVSPADAVDGIVQNWQSILSVRAVYMKTRAAVSFVDLPVTLVHADKDNGVISITVSGKNLSKYFYYAQEPASLSLRISDGNNAVNSDFIEMYPDVPRFKELRYAQYSGIESLIQNLPPFTLRQDGSWWVLSFKDNITTLSFRNSSNYSTPLFSSPKDVTDVVIPPTVTSIHSNALGSYIENVYIEDVEAWCKMSSFPQLASGWSLYLNNEKITQLVIPDTITQVPDFSNMSLESVIFHSGVTKIKLFQECSSLKSVYCRAVTPPELTLDAFGRYNSYWGRYDPIGCKIYVPAESVELYKNATNWSKYASYIYPEE